MRDYKLIKLIQVLNAEELKEVRAYLANGNKTIQELFRVLCQFHSSLDCTKLTKDYLYEKLFPKQPYNDGKMRKLMTHLSQSLEDYLISKELKKSDEIRAKLLSRAFEARGSYELFLETVETRISVLEKQNERGRDYFREKYELSDMVFFHPESDKLNRRNEFAGEAVVNFERYFILVTLQNGADNIIRSRLVKGQDNSHFIDTVKKTSQLQPFQAVRAIQFFNHIVSLLEGNKQEDLEQLKVGTFEAFKELSRYEQDMSLNLLRNYAAPLSNLGSMLHTKFILDLYKLEIERGFIRNLISAGTFMNIVTLGLTVKELEWVEYFISSFNKYLPNNEQALTLNYCQGFWHYHKGIKNESIEDFYKAQKLINMIPIRSSVYFELRVRVLSLRIHFEMFSRGQESLDEILSQFRNFERHITGNVDYSDPVRQSYLEFLRHFKTLTRIVGERKIHSKEVFDFLEKLKNLKTNFALKPWLLEKAKGLASPASPLGLS